MDGYFVYKIENLVNGKIYIGQSKEGRARKNKRFHEHISIANGGNINRKYPVHHAISKYGKHNFNFSIVEMLSSLEDANIAEKKWIKIFNSNNRNFGYNLTEGGDGNPGYKPSQETKDKISKSNTGKKKSEEVKHLLSLMKTGKKIGPRSEEQKLKISGKNHHFFGKHHSEEVKMKMSESGKKRINEIERERLKLISRGENNSNAKTTAEIVIKIREAHKEKKYNLKKLANVFGVSYSALKDIIYRKSWKHI